MLPRAAATTARMVDAERVRQRFRWKSAGCVGAVLFVCVRLLRTSDR